MSNEDQLATLRARVAINEDNIVKLMRTVESLRPCPEIPAMELASWEPGPVRVAFIVRPADEFLPAIDRRIVSNEEQGAFVESIQYQPVAKDVYSALIVFRMPKSEGSAT